MARLEQIVVVGAGLAGHRAAVTLREEGFAGRLMLVGAEPHLPYDRPPLSKEVLTGEKEPRATMLAGADKLEELGVELLLGRAATGLNLAARRVEVGSSAIDFDGLIIASGAHARSLRHLEGLPRTFTLRDLEDAVALRAALADARHVTVVGAGFIGSEVAASARALDREVVLIELETSPLARTIGSKMGAHLMGLHERNGTKLMLGTTIEGFEDGGKSIRLTNGERVETGLVVVGIGVTPNIAWLEDSGLELANGVVCDASLNAGAAGVFAVGDVASWPNELFGRRMRVEHWTNAVQQAAHAAKNLLHGHAEPFVGSNYVWSDQYGTRIQFAGIAAGEPELVSGDWDDGKFTAWYREGDRLVGVVGIGEARLLVKSRGLIEARATWDEAREALFS